MISILHAINVLQLSDIFLYIISHLIILHRIILLLLNFYFYPF